MRTNEQIAAELVATVKVDLGDGTWTPNKPLDFNFPPDGSVDQWGNPSNHKGQLAATAMIENELRLAGWHPVNLPWDEDCMSVVEEEICDKLGGIFITVNFTMSGDIAQSVSRDWLLFPDEAKETAYRVVM